MMRAGTGTSYILQTVGMPSEHYPPPALRLDLGTDSDYAHLQLVAFRRVSAVD